MGAGPLDIFLFRRGKMLFRDCEALNIKTPLGGSLLLFSTREKQQRKPPSARGVI
jgi:hypothetical protein